MKAVKKDIFDINKVTVVGSPTITEDGVASGFSNTNYLMTTEDGAFTNANEVIIKTRVGTGTIASGDALVVKRENSTKGLISIRTKQGQVYYSPNNGVSSVMITNANIIKLNSELEIIVKIKKENAYIFVKDINSGLSAEHTSSMDNEEVLASWSFTSIGAFANMEGKYIDLPSFSITVDGELVYSPTRPITFLERRKEGFDLSKFTVVGTPTITEDGIASGFSTSNYLEIPNLNLQNADTWEVEGVVQVFSQGVHDDKAWLSPTSANGLMLPVACEAGNTNIQYQLYLSSASYSWDIASNNSIKFPSGSRVKCNLKFTGTQYIYTCTNLDTNEVKKVEINSTLKIYQSPTRLGIKRTTGPLQAGDKIDLPSFSITVDGKEVFTGAKEKFYAIGD